MRAASVTVVVSGPAVARVAYQSLLGHLGISPLDGLNPTTPQCAAGMRTEPAPSPPCARGPSPAATAAAAPPEEPPGVRVRSQGFLAGGPSRLSVMSL